GRPGGAMWLLDDKGSVIGGNGQPPGERHQEPDLPFAEGVLAVEVLQRDQADRAIADQERREDGRLRDLPREHGGLPHFGAPRDQILVDHDGLARLDRVATVPDMYDRLVLL